MRGDKKGLAGGTLRFIVLDGPREAREGWRGPELDLLETAYRGP